MNRTSQIQSEPGNELVLEIRHEPVSELDLDNPFQANRFFSVLADAMGPADRVRETSLNAPGASTGKLRADSFTVRVAPPDPRPDAPTGFPMQVLDNVVAEEPSAFRYAYRGAVRWCLGQRDEAFDDFDKAIETDPAYVPAYVIRGITWMHMDGPYAPYQDLDLNLATKRDPRWPRSEIMSFIGPHMADSDASRDFATALELDPDYVPAIVAQSRCVINADLYKMARKQLSRAIALKPEYRESHVQRARAFMFMGKYPQALADLKRAAQIDPGSTIIPQLRSNALFLDDRQEKALQVMDGAVERFRHDLDLRRHRGLIRQLCRRLDLAEQDFSHVIQEQSMPYLALMQRGVLRILMGRHTDAIADYEAVINFQPDDDAAHLCKGRANLALRRYPEALADLHKALAYAPTSINALLARAEVRMRMRDFEAAHADVIAVLELNPDCVDAYLLRGCIRIEQAEYRMGIADLKFVLSEIPTDGMALCYMALADARRGRRKVARKGAARAFRMAERQGNWDVMRMVQEHFPGMGPGPRRPR